MLFRNLLLILFLIIVLPFVSAQDLKVIYHTSFKDQIDLNQFEEKYRKLIEKANENDLKKVYVFELIIAGKVSRYRFVDFLEPSPGSTYHSPTFYKQLGNAEVVADSPLLKKGEGLKRSFAEYEWTFHDTTQSILGYTCKKAIAKLGEKIYTVWYTDSLPYPDGPQTFGGLPGLILQLRTDKEITTAVSLEAQPPGTYKIDVPDFEKFISFEDFKKRIGF